MRLQQSYSCQGAICFNVAAEFGSITGWAEMDHRTSFKSYSQTVGIINILFRGHIGEKAARAKESCFSRVKKGPDCSWSIFSSLSAAVKQGGRSATAWAMDWPAARAATRVPTLAASNLGSSAALMVLMSPEQ